MRIRTDSIFSLGVIVAFSVLAVGVYQRVEPSIDELDEKPAVVKAPLRILPLDDSVAVAIRPTLASGQVLRSPVDIVGIVSAIGDGAEVSNGDVALTVDGIDRLVWATEDPFYRPLGYLDEGDDVRALQEVLQELEFRTTPPSGLYDRVTAREVKAFATSIGADTSEYSPSQRFDPAWIVWVAVSPIHDVSWHVQVGQAAPTTGDILGASPDRIEGIDVRNDAGEEVTLDGQWTLRADGVELLTVDGVPTSGLRELEEVLEALQSQDQDQSNSVDAIARRVEARTALVAPASAVALARDGTTCLFVSDGTSFPSIEVLTRELGNGGVEVVGEVGEGDEVLVNHAEVLGAVDTC